jgi:hypothetical protein
MATSFLVFKNDRRLHITRMKIWKTVERPQAFDNDGEGATSGW